MCTKASRDSGKTSWAEASRSGATGTPSLQAAFPAELADVDLDTFYRAINTVVPSLIRTEADEVTYNLHVMLRFDLELAHAGRNARGLRSARSVARAPHARPRRHPLDDRDGALQDVHWYGGIVGGAFQSYTLGNIMSAQFFAAARRALPNLDAQVGAGDFAPLRTWLTANIYRHGRKFTAPEIVRARDRSAAVDRALPRVSQHQVRRAVRLVIRAPQPTAPTGPPNRLQS